MEEGSEIEWKCKSKVSSMDLQSYAYVTKTRQMKLLHFEKLKSVQTWWWWWQDGCVFFRDCGQSATPSHASISADTAENPFMKTDFSPIRWSHNLSKPLLLFAMGVWRNIQGVEIRDTICFDNRRFVKIRGPDILRFSLEIKCDRCWCFWWNIGKSQPIDFSSP